MILVTGPLSVRLLGVEGRGEAAIVFSIAILVGQVVPWGLPQAFGFVIASGDADPRSVLLAHGRRYAIRCIWAGLLGGLAVAGLVFVQPVDGPGIAIALGAVGSIITMAVVLVICCLQGASRFTALAAIQLVPALFYAASLIALMAVGHRSVATVLVLYFTGWFVAGAAGLVLLLRARDAPSRVPTSIRQLRSFGRRVIVAAAAPIDNLGIDQLAVAVLLGPHALGTYVIAIAFKSPLSMLFASLAGVCSTQIASIAEPDRVRAACRRWLIISLAAGLVAGVGLELAIGLLLEPAFGREAGAAREAAQWLVLAGIPLGLRRVISAMLQGLGRPADASRAEMIGLAVMLVSMAVLAQHGIVGAVAGAGLGGIVAVICGGLSLSQGLRRGATRPAPHGSARQFGSR